MEAHEYLLTGGGGKLDKILQKAGMVEKPDDPMADEVAESMKRGKGRRKKMPGLEAATGGCGTRGGKGGACAGGCLSDTFPPDSYAP